MLAASPQTGTPGAVLIGEGEAVVEAEVEFKARTCWWAPATHAAQANGQIWRRTATILQALDEIQVRESLSQDRPSFLQVRAGNPIL